MNESEEIITVMLLISVVPLLTQMPCAFVKIIQLFSEPFNVWVSRALVALFPTTAATNSYITIFVIRDYRKNIKKWFRRKTVSPVVQFHFQQELRPPALPQRSTCSVNSVYQ